MSDSSERDGREDVTDEVPSTDEKTVFDTEMLARLNALGDDDDDDDELEADASPAADVTMDRELDDVDAIPSNVSSLQDIGDLVEPLSQEVPATQDITSSSINKMLTDEVGEETKDADPAVMDEDDSELSRSRVTRPGFQSAPRAQLSEVTPVEGSALDPQAVAGELSEPEVTAEEPAGESDDTRSGADLWDDPSEPGDRSLSSAPSLGSDQTAEATAALVVEPMPETGDVELALGDQTSGEDRTDRETAPEMVRLECTGEHPAIEIADRALVLGRSSSCDIPIADPTMSRRHVNIWLREGRVWVEDLGSGNGTWINDQRIAEPTALEAGDRLRLGQNVVFLMPQASEPEADEEPVTKMASVGDQPLLGPSGGHSTTYAHDHPGRLSARLRVFAPLIAASLLFAVGASVFFVRQSRANARQAQLNSATANFFQGIEHMRTGSYKLAGAHFATVSELDPEHPRLPLYRKTAQKLMNQADQLDRAEVALKEGRLQDAAATLTTIDVEPSLKERLDKLNRRIDVGRLAGRAQAFKDAVAGGDRETAARILSELRSAGMEREELEPLEAMLDKAGAPKAKSSGGSGRSGRSDQGPLKRVHQALRQGRVEEAFRINKDLAASGVKEAAKLEDTGNLGELRELIRMAQSAEGKKDWSRILKSTARGLKLVKRISPRASGTRRQLNNLRANGYYFRASKAASKSDFCGARRYLLQARKLDRNHPKVKSGLSKTEAFAATQVERAKKEIKKGFSVADVREILKTALCTSSASSPAHKEAKRILRGR